MLESSTQIRSRRGPPGDRLTILGSLRPQVCLGMCVGTAARTKERPQQVCITHTPDCILYRLDTIYERCVLELHLHDKAKQFSQIMRRAHIFAGVMIYRNGFWSECPMSTHARKLHKHSHLDSNALASLAHWPLALPRARTKVSFGLDTRGNFDTQKRTMTHCDDTFCHCDSLWQSRGPQVLDASWGFQMPPALMWRKRHIGAFWF